MKFQTVILCDDIRAEDNGKLILIGVYLADIQFAAFPAQFAPRIWAQFFVDRNGKIPIEFRVLQDRRPLALGKGDLDVNDHTKPVNLSLPHIPIKIDGPCTLFIQMREVGKRWKTMKKLPVDWR